MFSLHAQTRGGGLEIKTPNGDNVITFSQGYALVIGEIDYRYWQPLKSVRDDVTTVTKLFEEQKFIVETLVDKTSDDLKRGIENFLNKYGHEEKARLIIYFAGHGDTQKLPTGMDMGYIVPIDAPKYDVDSIGFLQKSIPMNQFDAWSKQYACRHILFIFDSCFSGTIFNTRGEPPVYITKSITEPVRQFITSGNKDETVPEPSVFRPLLERALKNGEADKNKDGYISGTELGKYLHDEVTSRYDNKWTPQYGKSKEPNLDKGDFIFVVGNSSNQVVYIVEDRNQDQIKIFDNAGTEFFVGTWVSNVEYNNSIDTYTITFNANGRCTVKLTNDEAEQVTNGNWSLKKEQTGTFLKISAVFRNAKITYQRNIQWESLVTFEGGNNSFNILAKPAANFSGNILFRFNKD
jgi:hypothetical protein